MQELTKEAKLMAIVVASSESANSCALRRLAKWQLINDGLQTKFLEEAAARLGFSDAEAKGIMDGWDSATKLSLMNPNGYFTMHANEPGYAEGHTLGVACAKAAKCSP